MERSRSYQDETLKQDLTLCISNSIDLGCRCILSPPQRTLRPNASSSIHLAISNHRLSPCPLHQRTPCNCQLIPNPNMRVRNRSVNATTLYTMQHRRLCSSTSENTATLPSRNNSNTWADSAHTPSKTTMTSPRDCHRRHQQWERSTISRPIPPWTTSVST